MAMAAAVAALAAGPGERSLITGFDATETSYPAFAEDLRSLIGTGPAAGPAAAGDRHRRAGRSGEVDRLAGGGRHAWGSSASIPGPCTVPWPPWPWPARIAPDDEPAVAALAAGRHHLGRPRAW